MNKPRQYCVYQSLGRIKTQFKQQHKFEANIMQNMASAASKKVNAAVGACSSRASAESPSDSKSTGIGTSGSNRHSDNLTNWSHITSNLLEGWINEKISIYRKVRIIKYYFQEPIWMNITLQILMQIIKNCSLKSLQFMPQHRNKGLVCC